MSKNPPDWWARGGALAGIGLSIIGLGLTYRNSSWQQQVYEESLQERIIIHLGMARTSVSGGNTLTFESKGKVSVEVTNIGLHPIYLKSIRTGLGGPVGNMITGAPSLIVYQPDPIEGKEPLKRLEPGEAFPFVKDADFSEYPLNFDSNSWVRVETTTKVFSQQVRVSLFNISGDVGWPMPKHKKK